MHSRSQFEDSSEPAAGSEQSLRRPRQARLRRYLDRFVAAVVTLFSHKKAKNPEYDIPLGDQVRLPAEFLETLSRIPGSQDRK